MAELESIELSVPFSLFEWHCPVAVGREGRILREHTRHVGVAKDLPAAPVRILEDGLRGTHRAIPIKRSLELLFMALCLHIFYLSSLNGLTALFSFSTIQRTKGL